VPKAVISVRRFLSAYYQAKGPAQLPGPRSLMPSASSDQWLEAGVLLEEFEFLDPAVQPEDVARALDDQLN
jgi:hypothetical protein